MPRPAPDDSARRREQARAAARLRALGIDVAAMDHEQLRQAWEGSRAAYITIAGAGQHMTPIHADGDPLSGACVHARFGMLRDALAAYHGAWPDGWSAPRVDWPHHGQHQAPNISVVQEHTVEPRALPPGSPAAPGDRAPIVTLH